MHAIHPSIKRSRPLALALGVAAAALALPSVAGAHVTVNPKTVPAGSYPELEIRVPSESETASTTKVAVQFPPGFAYVAQEELPGWTVSMKKSKLATPIKTDDGEITEQIDSITWTGTGKGEGAVPPGTFKDFPIVASVPGKAGDVLTFKAVQTYSDGSVVRWIGDPSADKPAPTVTLTDAADAAPTSPATPAEPAAVATASGGASKGLAIGGLVVGIVGVLLGGAALLSTRKVA